MQPADEALPTPADLFEHAACGLLLTRIDGTILQANTTLCDWIGYPGGDLVGRSLQDLLTIGGRVFHQTHWAPLMQMQGSVAEVKLELVHRDGTRIPMLINAIRRGNEASSYDELALMVVQDRHSYERELLTARKNAETALLLQQETQKARALAEARLRLALDAGQLHIWDIDAATGQRRYDDSVAALLGLAHPTTLTPAQFDRCIEPADREAEADAFAEATDAASGNYQAIYRLNGIDGVQRTVRSSGKATFDDQGRLRQFVGVLHDISELTRQRAQAESRAQFAEQMVGIVSHDLRNPLSAILMSAHVIGRGEVSTHQMRAVSRIVSATNRAQRLIADLLDFTQARVGTGLSVSLRPTDLHAVAAHSIEELASAYPDRPLRHVQHGEGNCNADADRLAQMMGNLISNAISYGAIGRPVTLTTRIDNREVLVCVHNEGEVIAQDVIPRLFEPMTRGGTEAGGDRGVGLGLFIVREIVNAHQGAVEVLSTVATGTLFTARWPRRPEPGGTIAQA